MSTPPHLDLLSQIVVIKSNARPLQQTMRSCHAQAGLVHEHTGVHRRAGTQGRPAATQTPRLTASAAFAFLQ